MNIQEIYLDISKQVKVRTLVRLAQGDSGGATIVAHVSDGGLPIDLTGMTAMFEMRTPDGIHYVRDARCSVDGDAITYVVDEDHVCPVAGYTDDAYFDIMDGPSVIYSTARFRVEIIRSAHDGAEVADNWDNAVEAYFKTIDARQDANDARQDENDLSQAKNDADQALNNQWASGIVIRVLAEGEYDPETLVPSIDDPRTGTMYLVPSGEEGDPYYEYIWTDGWDLVGSSSYSSDPITTEQIDEVADDDAPSGDQTLNLTGLSYLWAKVKALILDVWPTSRGGTGATSASKNSVFAGPTAVSGPPTFRALVADDIPEIDVSKVSGAVTTTQLGSYLPLSGGTLSGNLTIKGQTTDSVAYNATNPKIQFDNQVSNQRGQLIFTDYDSVDEGASLTFVTDQAKGWLRSQYVRATAQMRAYAAGSSYVAVAKQRLAAFFGDKATGSDNWAPALGFPTKGGGVWCLGNYNDETAQFAYVSKANIDSDNNAPVVVKLPTTSGTLALTSQLTPSVVGALPTRPASIEFQPGGSAVNNGGFIDFHYNQSTADYTSRLIEEGSGVLAAYGGTLRVRSGASPALVVLSTANAAAANNGFASGTVYPAVWIGDAANRIMARLEAVVNSNGSIGSYWYVRNYKTDGTMVAQKGIAMYMAKDGTLTYSVADAANFRSAIGANSAGNITSGTLPVARGGTGKTGGSWYGAYSLYANDTGTNGTVTLSETAANFSVMLVCFKGNDGYQASLTVVAPNGKKVAMLVAESTSNNMHIKRRTATISGTTITTNNYAEVDNVGANTNAVAATNHIYITRVWGFK